MPLTQLHVSTYDIEAPVTDLLPLFEKLAAEHPGSSAYLVELAGAPGRAPSLAFLGWHPLAELPETGVSFSTLDRLREAVGSLRFTGPGTAHPLFCQPFSHGWTGYLSYEAAGLIEPTLHLPPSGQPPYRFLLPGRVLVQDHGGRRVTLFVFEGAEPNRGRMEEHRREVDGITARLSTLRAAAPAEIGGRAPAHVTADTVSVALDSREKFYGQVSRAQDHIRAGDVFQAVLSRRWLLPSRPRPTALYRALRHLNPSPYHYLLKTGGGKGPALVGASPERLVSVQSGTVQTRPIAGTRPRPGSRREDALIAAELLSDPKERAEHTMLVDLARNDLGRVASFGSVEVPRFMVIEAFSHVLHLVSDVTAELHRDRGSIDALLACFPAGTLSGAPKVQAMQLIAEIERRPRGPYGGAVTWFGGPSELESVITIRTAVYEGKSVWIQAGAGIVADSVPEREADETEKKAAALFAAAATASKEDTAQ